MTPGTVLRTLVLTSLAAALALSVAAQDAAFSDDFAQPGRPGAPWNFVGSPAEPFWTAQDGWLRTGKGVDLVTVDGYSFAVADLAEAREWQDYAVSTNFCMPSASGRVCLLGRWRNRENHYRATIEVFGGRTLVKIIKVERGESSELASRVLDPETVGATAVAGTGPDSKLAFAFTMNASSLTMLVNGETVISAKDLAHGAGLPGLGFSLGEVWFDDCRVVLASGGEEAAPAVSDLQDAQVHHTVQVGRFQNLSDAQAILRALRREGYAPYMEPAQSGEGFVVYVGRFSSHSEATRMALILANDDYAYAKVVSRRPGEGAPPADDTAPRIGEGEDDLGAPAAVLETADIEDLTPAQREKLVEIMMMDRAARTQVQSLEQILELKQRIDDLDERQASILNEMRASEDERKERQISISRLRASINRSIEAEDYDQAMADIEKIETIDPNSPIASMLRTKVTHLMNNSWEGMDQFLKQRREEIRQLKAEAERVAAEDPERAREIWAAILAKAPEDATLQQEAAAQVRALDLRVDAERDVAQRERDAAQMQKVYIVVGGVAALFLVVIVMIYVAGRRRYARMLQQIQDDAIAPLQELRRTGALGAGGGAAAGLSVEGADQSLLGQTDESQSEFMIPDRGPGEGEAESSSAFDPLGGLADVDEGEVKTPAAVEKEKDEEGIPDFGDFDEEEEKPAGSTATPAAESTLEDDELAFSFDEIEPELEETAPQSGAGVPAAEEEEEEEALVFSFDEEGDPGVVETEAEKPKAETGGEEYDIPDTTGYDDLDLDLSLGEEEETPKAAAGAESGETEEPNPLDLDLEVDMSDVSEGEALNPLVSEEEEKAPAREAAPEAPAEAEEAESAFDLSDATTGQMPPGWQGEQTGYATLQVVADDQGEGKCIRFQKTQGEGTTHFNLPFPPVSGNVEVAFDIRCDEKNKHLLGVYVEEDGDFRKAVHAVVQQTAPDQPAHLRIFTRPTPYEMGAWRTVRFEVDMEKGLVDGSVDGEKVAEGVQMGTKAEKLNTLTIRDNADTTGTLYLRNIRVRSV